MNEAYATQMSVEWHLPTKGAAYVTKFEVDADYLQKFKVENVGGEIHNELWVPSEKLEEFNKHIVGKIEVIAGHSRTFPEDKKFVVGKL